MISIVIPAYNEQGAIVTTINQIQKTMDESQVSPWEIVIVDDGSLDETPVHLKTLCDLPYLTVIRHPHNLGYGRSLKDGILAAQYDTIVITDADS